MQKIRFGKTELMVSKIALGGIPIERVSVEEAVKVVRGAIDLGVNFIDTANGYSDSEEKIGLAIKGIPRGDLVITSKSLAKDKQGILQHIDLSLKRLGTDYIDLYQLHNVINSEVFNEGGAFEGLMEAVRAGKVRFPAFSSHSAPFACQLMREGKFFAVQLPFNYVDDEAAQEAIPLAKELDIGFIAMKPFGGGRLDSAELSIKFLAQFDNIVPDPGIETLAEIEEIVRIAAKADSTLVAGDLAAIQAKKAELGGLWCHRCDYCQPCPQKIAISSALTVEMFLKRLPFSRVLALAKPAMEAARACTECRSCIKRCPYNLDIPNIIKEKLSMWDRYVEENS